MSYKRLERRKDGKYQLHLIGGNGHYAWVLDSEEIDRLAEDIRTLKYAKGIDIIAHGWIEWPSAAEREDE